VPGWPIDHCARAAVESISATPAPTMTLLKSLFMPVLLEP
jgi:hypothetical protein